MKKQTMTLAGIPAILYGSRSRKVYLYLHGKNGCKEEAERLPLQPVKRAGRCWLSTCPSMAHGKTALSGFCRGWLCRR